MNIPRIVVRLGAIDFDILSADSKLIRRLLVFSKERNATSCAAWSVSQQDLQRATQVVVELQRSVKDWM
jgi:hypothetical protein